MISSFARLEATIGKAEPSELKIEKQRVNIGRTRDAAQNGGPTRHNDIAFAEDDAIGKTVSRQHAHVELDVKTSQYRLFNDRIYKGADQCGLYLLRAGVSQPIHRGGHGLLLQSGDEIHLGQAVLVFHLD